MCLLLDIMYVGGSGRVCESDISVLTPQLNSFPCYSVVYRSLDGLLCSAFLSPAGVCVCMYVLLDYSMCT